MKLKKLLVLLLCVCLSFALAACQGKNDQGGAQNTPPPQQTTGDQQSAGNVNFGLQAAPTPDFDSPAVGDDSGKLYTIVGDYAYELDPSTLQPVGDPLDPVTHQPVSNPVLDGENPSTPNNPQNNPAPAADPAPAPDPEPAPEPEPAPAEPAKPAPSTSLPNTGMFLEDD